jgi:hypothetical protein
MRRCRAVPGLQVAIVEAATSQVRLARPSAVPTFPSLSNEDRVAPQQDTMLDAFGDVLQPQPVPQLPRTA